MQNISTNSTFGLIDKICEKYDGLLKKVISEQNNNKKRKHVHIEKNEQCKVRKINKPNNKCVEKLLQIPAIGYEELDELNKSIIQLNELKLPCDETNKDNNYNNDKSENLLFEICKNYKNDLIMIDNSGIKEDIKISFDIDYNKTMSSDDSQTSDDFTIINSNIDFESELEKLI